MLATCWQTPEAFSYSEGEGARWVLQQGRGMWCCPHVPMGQDRSPSGQACKPKMFAFGDPLSMSCSAGPDVYKHLAATPVVCG